MANPQKENGYTKIANEILLALAGWHFSSYEAQILFVILRKTYGWNKKRDWISLSQFVLITNINESHASRALNMLLKQNIITKEGSRNKPEWCFQKNYEKWVRLPKGVRSHHKLLTKGGNNDLPKGVFQGLPKGGDTKETITKETIQRKKLRSFYKKVFNETEWRSELVRWRKRGERVFKNKKLIIKNGKKLLLDQNGQWEELRFKLYGERKPTTT